jgi:transcription termination/antitermination protein NusG
MSDPNPQQTPIATDPASDEEAVIVEQAESGDPEAALAQEEAGGPSPFDEDLGESAEALEQLAESVPAEAAAEAEAPPEPEAEAPPEPEAEAPPEPEAEAPPEPEAEAPPEPEAEAPPEAEAAPEPEAGEEPPEIPGSPFDGPGEWYVVHTYAGYENKVKTNLHSRIGSMQMEGKIFDVVIPMEDVMEIKGGKKQVVQRKVFPGYLLVKMVYDNDSWYVVRNTPGVTGFVSSGTGTKPTPLSRREVEKILTVKEEARVKPQYRLEWEEGDVVRIIAGPFADFTGTIAEINVEQSKLKVLVNIFDRETPVELAFDQVAKS